MCRFNFYNSGDTDDNFYITVGANGVTTFSNFDSEKSCCVTFFLKAPDREKHFLEFRIRGNI